MANQAGAANTWTESRSDAMGGTGVASGSYGSGALINPALLAKAKPDDDVTVILPSVGAQITDEDNLQDEIDNINDKINHYKDVVDNLTPREIITNPLGSINQFQWIGPYISIHFLSLNPLLVRRRRYSRGERYPSALCGCHSL